MSGECFLRFDSLCANAWMCIDGTFVLISARYQAPPDAWVGFSTFDDPLP